MLVVGRGGGGRGKIQEGLLAEGRGISSGKESIENSLSLSSVY